MTTEAALPGAISSAPAPEGLDLAWERAVTVGADESHHFNAAGAALPTTGVVETVVAHLRREQQIGGYEAAAEAKDRHDAVYASAAALLGAHADEIALFDSASSALRVLIDALVPAVATRVIATRSTYVSHALHLMSLADRFGVELIVLPVGEDRGADLVELARLLADGTPTVVTASHIPTSSGQVEPVVELGRVCREHGAVYLLDATQSVGHLDIDVDRIGCDLLVTTGRKFLRGPRGTAFAYVRRDLCERLASPAPDVRASTWTGHDEWTTQPIARRFETWEAGIAGRLGLGRAIDEALARGMDATEERLLAVSDAIRHALTTVPGVVGADPAGTRSALITFTVDGVRAADVVTALAGRRVRVVSVPATHGQWDLGDRGVEAVVRVSPHVYNDDADIAALVAAVTAVAAEGPAR